MDSNMLHTIYDAAIAIIAPMVLGVIGWVFSITNRISVLEEAKDGLKELITSKFDDVQRQLAELRSIIRERE